MGAYILAGLGGLLVLTVATLVALGSRSSAGRFETTVEIAQPAPVVFERISEPARLKAHGSDGSSTSSR